MVIAGEFSRDLEGGMNLILIVSISGDALKISGSSPHPLHDNFRAIQVPRGPLGNTCGTKI